MRRLFNGPAAADVLSRHWCCGGASLVERLKRAGGGRRFLPDRRTPPAGPGCLSFSGDHLPERQTLARAWRGIYVQFWTQAPAALRKRVAESAATSPRRQPSPFPHLEWTVGGRPRARRTISLPCTPVRSGRRRFRAFHDPRPHLHGKIASDSPEPVLISAPRGVRR
jgi:hypothetical protein